MAGVDLTAQRLRELLDYDPATGLFVRKVSRPKAPAGSIAGTIQHNRRLHICVDSRVYLAHRLAWLHFYGEWPKYWIDHINGDPSDNRISNLRDVTQAVNQQNQRRGWGVTGVLGVTPARGRFRAVINVKRKNVCLGTFDTLTEAQEAYLNAKRIHHPGCTI